ncbi:MAG: hypothetical protein AAGA32_00805 [Pseudomonadota bacterium]
MGTACTYDLREGTTLMADRAPDTNSIGDAALKRWVCTFRLETL